MSQPCIAIDDESLRKLEARVLGQLGHKVLQAADLREVMRLAAAIPTIHLLVTDFSRPEANGLELTRQFRQLHPRTPVLMLSGSLQAIQDRHEHLDGFAVLEKPFAYEELVGQVCALLNGAVPGVTPPRATPNTVSHPLGLFSAAMTDQGIEVQRGTEPDTQHARVSAEPLDLRRSLLPERLDVPSDLRISEIRYRRLFEAARDGILIIDPHTRKITDANPFMTELLGYSRQELLGKELWEIGLLKDEAASQAAFRELQKNHFIRYENLPLQSNAGLHHEVEFVSNLYDEDGRNVIQCNIRDITQRKWTEDALRRAKSMLADHAANLELLVDERTASLRETLGELQAFSYTVSHDMRSPLRAMQGFAQILLDDYGAKLDAQGIHYVRQIMRSAVRLDHLTRDVLSYSTVLHADSFMESVDLDGLIRDLIQTYPNGQKTEFHIQGKLPTVLGNQALLTQCFSNLLGNAAKFVSPGTIPRITIRAEDQTTLARESPPAAVQPSATPAPGNGTVRIWIEDNGIGIAPENHERIFRMFERINPGCEYEGTGIGLAIVRKAAERMRAQFGLESALDKGSKFWIQLEKA